MRSRARRSTTSPASPARAALTRATAAGRRATSPARRLAEPRRLHEIDAQVAAARPPARACGARRPRPRAARRAAARRRRRAARHLGHRRLDDAGPRFAERTGTCLRGALRPRCRSPSSTRPRATLPRPAVHAACALEHRVGGLRDAVPAMGRQRGYRGAEAALGGPACEKGGRIEARWSTASTTSTTRAACGRRSTCGSGCSTPQRQLRTRERRRRRRS